MWQQVARGGEPQLQRRAAPRTTACAFAAAAAAAAAAAGGRPLALAALDELQLHAARRAAAAAASAAHVQPARGGVLVQRRADVAAAPADAPVVLVASEDRARGLDIAGVEAVLILGGPANADTFVHLSGRVYRDPLSLANGPEPSVVTIGRKRDIDQVRGWLSELGEEITELSD